MNIEFANRLAALRKEHNLSQEELAGKIGVSRQAISKWECGESSPDTDNLIALSNVYGISLDELVHGTSSASTAQTPENGDKEIHVKVPGAEVTIHANDDDDDDDDDDDEDKSLSPKMKTAIKIISAIGFPLAAVAYLLCGFLWSAPDGGAVGWASMWVLFLVPCVIMGLVRAIGKKSANQFPLPVLLVGVYCGMGIIGGFYGVNLWHPYWLMFFLIPLYHGLCGILEHKNKGKE